MVDLFGKKKYEERIIELESRLGELEKSRSDLEKTLEKRDERIKKLASDYQDAKVALKEAESRLVAASSQTKPKKEDEVIKEGKVAGTRLESPDVLRLLDRLGECSSNREDLLTCFIPKDEFDDIPSVIQSVGNVRQDLGLAVFHYPNLFTLALAPPFPITKKSILQKDKFELNNFEDMMETPIFVISAHAGETLIGVSLSHLKFETFDLVRTSVKEKHGKGGWSQRRFERLREEDIRHHADTVIEKVKEVLPKYRPLLKYAVISGDTSVTKFILPELDMPIIEMKLKAHGKNTEEFVFEVYGSYLYRL